MSLVVPVACATFTNTSTSTLSVSVWPERPRPGDLVSIEVTGCTVSDRRRTEPKATPKKSGQRYVDLLGFRTSLVSIDAGRCRAWAAVPIETLPAEVAFVVVVGERTKLSKFVVHDRSFDESVLSVNPKFTASPSPKLKERLRREEQSWANLWSVRPGLSHFSGAWIRPADGEVRSTFGERRVFNGQLKSRHYGLDLDGVIGAHVRAAQAGRVVLSAMRFTAGGTVVIDHGGGLFSAYFHLSKRFKTTGAWVAAGETIGLIGNTGRVTGPHLHFSVLVRAESLEAGGRPKRTRGLFVDPAPILRDVFNVAPEYVLAPPQGRR